MKKEIHLALIGAGNRGQGIFGQYALDMPHRVKFTAVAEPDKKKREQFSANHKIAPNRVFADYNDFFKADIRDIDGVVIATQEDHRIDPLFESVKKNYNILVEKPLCTTPADLIRLYNGIKNHNRVLIVCHQMRLTPRMRCVKNLIDSGKYGKVVCIQHSENLSYHHMAHSFVRGFFNSEKLSPMLLAKSCHDLDLITFLLGKKAKKIASFGSLNHFHKKNAPKDAPLFCLSGCPQYAACPYSVLKLYFEPDTDPAYIRQMGVVENKQHLLELLKTNRFGRCVFQTDNDVVDNQSVQIEYEDDVHVSFTMCGHNGIERRMTKISMTNGEIEINGRDEYIYVHSFEPLSEERIKVNSGGTHGGGDRAIMDNFTDALATGDTSQLLTPIKDSFEGHLLVFAAEHSRKEGKVVDVREYETLLRKENPGK